jgi:type I restriction enzyme, S subunit
MSKSLLPGLWMKATLSEVAEINPRHAKELNDSLLVSFAPMTALSESGANFHFLTERRLGEVRKGFTHFSEGDVLFAKITPCMENGKGAVAVGLRNRLGCGTTELHVFRPQCGVDPHYLYYFLHQQSFRRAAKSNFTGTAGQARVPSAFIEQAEIPLAPLAEQSRIVAKLEKLLGKVDSCQRRLAKIPFLLKRFRQAVLAAACSGELTADWRETNLASKNGYAGDQDIDGELPPNWQNQQFEKFITSSFYGPRFGAESYIPDGVPTIRTTDITFDGTISLRDPPRVKVSSHEFERYKLRNGDLLVTRTGATIGKCALYDESVGPAIPGAYLIRFRLDQENLLPRFALIFLSCPHGQALLVGGTTAVAQPNVNAKSISKFTIPIPPIAEQEQIVRRVNELFAQADQIEARFAKASEFIRVLNESILAKAFRGELAPQDPNDEPATILLERIREARVRQHADRSKQKGRQPRASRTKDVAFVNADSENGPEAARKN